MHYLNRNRVFLFVWSFFPRNENKNSFACQKMWLRLATSILQFAGLSSFCIHYSRYPLLVGCNMFQIHPVLHFYQHDSQNFVILSCTYSKLTQEASDLFSLPFAEQQKSPTGLYVAIIIRSKSSWFIAYLMWNLHFKACLTTIWIAGLYSFKNSEESRKVVTMERIEKLKPMYVIFIH